MVIGAPRLLLTAYRSPYSAANSAPHLSQYHSVGRLSEPHSPHFSVLATVGLGRSSPSGLTAAGAVLIWREPTGGESSVTERRNASSSCCWPPVCVGAAGGIGA